MRVVQVANFVTPTSGGLRTTLRHLAAGYVAAGHDVVQVLPAKADAVARSAGLTQVHLAAAALPGTGYRVHVDIRRVRRVLADLAPDVLEVHDRTTLRGLGEWAATEGVRSCVISHERLDRWLDQWAPRAFPRKRFADRSNAALAASYDVVICTTQWAAAEFERIEARNLRIVPLGVDMSAFRPRLDPRDNDTVRLLMTTRLSREKRPDLGVAAVRELVRRGLRVRLDVCGDGPMRRELWRLGRDLPIHWRGHVGGRALLAQLMREADVALAPGPIETFGLAAIESMACGTPAVVNRHSALPALVGDAGRAAPSSGWCFADAVQELLAVDESRRRVAARRQAERFDWGATVAGFLDAHRAPTVAMAG